MLFDALIYNTDRHLGNFGLIFDTQTGEILRPAPIFDNGCSLFSLLQKDDLKDIFSTLCVHKSYFDLAFIDQIVLFVRKRHIKNLQRLLNFSFKRHENSTLIMNSLGLYHNGIEVQNIAYAFENLDKNS